MTEFETTAELDDSSVTKVRSDIEDELASVAVTTDGSVISSQVGGGFPTVAFDV